ncbi:MAG: AAA family ATPase [Oscillospiraceae bacterium]|nr:AAA family ATPase [Oscillospiraceae bacterium]
MTEQEERYFHLLVNKRTAGADWLDEPFMSGVKVSVTEKYSDSAHFIYELLQNADDAGATSARFVLYPDKLIFAHNGTERFTISDPDTEQEDRERGTLGHINAITSIGHSTKNKAKIGKFGIGFKAVFQYTATPCIYDPDIFFRITRFIVPERLDTDYPERKAEETLFVFPFDNGKMSKKDAYADISEKLRTLSFPVLFLSKLETVTFQAGDDSGAYGKQTLQTRTFGDTAAQLLELSGERGKEHLWLFSRSDESGRMYSAGFFLNEAGKLRKCDEAAFCFFPTKEQTGLNFIIHAPFLLTDSREGIKAGEKHNKTMIELLANLAADSLSYLRDIGEESGVRLIDDGILNIIPTDSNRFQNSGGRISFAPFYEAIKKKLQTDKLLPTKTGYAVSRHAYYADSLEIMDVFTDEHLQYMTKDPDAQWIFVTTGAKSAYVKDLIGFHRIISEHDIFYGRLRSSLRRALIRGIDAAFIERQPLAWLHKFYKWVSESEARKELARKRPLFLSKNGKALPAYDDNNRLILFLPSGEMPLEEKTVHPALLENEQTAAFLESLGITEPSKRDYIYNEILSQYEDDADIDTEPHFKLFFAYYRECPNAETDSFIDLIRGCEFVSYSSAKDATIYRGCASDLYFPTKQLREYFAAKPETLFVDWKGYLPLVKDNERKYLESFLSELGVKKTVSISVEPISSNVGVTRRYDWFSGHRHSDTWWEPRIDGLQEALRAIKSSKSESQSVTLWNVLLGFMESLPKGKTLAASLTGTFEHWPQGKGNHAHRTGTFDSQDMSGLRQKPWLVDKDGQFLPPCEMTRESLSPLYDDKHACAKELIDFLQFKPVAPPVDQNRYLTKKQRALLALAEAAEKAGVTDSAELLRFIEEGKKADERRRNRERNQDTQRENDAYESDTDAPDEEQTIAPSVRRTRRDIIRRTHSVPTYPKEPPEPKARQDAGDWDEYTRPTVDYAKKLEREEEKSARELDRIAYLRELQDKALELEQYSLGWFKVLLELEELSGEENSLDSREISIRFGHVELEPGTVRTLVLSQPSRGIPRFMEDLSNIPLLLRMDSGNKTLGIEVVSIRGYSLRVKLKSGAELDDIDLSAVKEACIDARNPSFLLKEWRTAFDRLSVPDTENLRDKLCENIRFIFGPPGTGKTTYLANAVLLPLMRREKYVRVLVLTPTNKAADVLTARIMEVTGDDLSWREWLVRFGATQDEDIERRGAYREKTLDIRKLSRSVTITTIDRFPYDYFMTGSGERLTLDGLRWDYIVFDEASMIPLFKIIYPLHRKTPREFIIAGDPFQIGPVASVSIWKDENIYSMVQLASFDAPRTIPHNYPVETLTTQYRSVPEIGELFSRLTYGGILKHYRTSGGRRNLGLESVLKVEAVNIVKFPVSQYESVHRAKKLENSPYQIYSALFAYEFASFLAARIHEANKDEHFQIGIITPYKAQADLIEKLLLSSATPDTVEVIAGTIHTFQGDECDILLALFNPPPYISASKEMFLNRRNIINVSISRARDYLFMLMPDERTENVGNLEIVLTVEGLIKEQAAWTEYHSAELEKLMFQNERFIEENTFSTSHQSVNVYEIPEKRYEVRSEDSAVDIQKRYKNNPER